MRWIALVAVAVCLVTPVTAQTPQELETAIESRRAALLKRTQQRVAEYRARPPDVGKHGLGRVALASLALLRAGTPPAQLDDLFRWMKTRPFHWTYDVSLYLLALEARGVHRIPPAPKPIRASEEGKGTRTRRDVPQHAKDRLTPQDQKQLARAASWLIQVFHARVGCWAYGGPVGEGWWQDHSNTQFAVHALSAAARSGYQVPRGVWDAVARHFTATIERTKGKSDVRSVGFSEDSVLGAWLKERKDDAQAGGWSYVPRHTNGPNSSMTAAGLFCLATAYAHLRKSGVRRGDAKVLRAMRDGVAWFRRHWTFSMPTKNKGNTPGYHLFSTLKALQTVGVLTLGELDWWRDGTRRLVKGTAPQDLVEASFELLWLNRGVLPPRKRRPQDPPSSAGRVVTGGQDGIPWDQVQVEGLGRVRASDLLRLLNNKGARNVRRRMREADLAVRALRPTALLRVLPDLQALMAAEAPSVRRWARRLVFDLLGTDQIAVVAARWETWRRLTGPGEQRSGRVRLARAVLQDERTPEAIRRTALSALLRARAVEATGDVIAQLNDGNLAYRRFTTWVLRGLGGPALPFDPKASDARRAKQARALRDAWIKAHGPELRDRIRADLMLLADPGQRAAATERLRAAGLDAVPALIGALTDPSLRDLAHGLLKGITGQDLPPRLAPWLTWHANGVRPRPVDPDRSRTETLWSLVSRTLP